MTEKTKIQLGEAHTAFEKRTLAYIEPLLTEINEEDIAGRKLTLARCWSFCHNKGSKLAVGGCADISEEQEREWVREYFGIEAVEAAAPKEPLKLSGSTQKLNLDLDSLFD